MRDMVSQEAILSTYYDPFALLLTDDAMQFAGMLGKTHHDASLHSAQTACHRHIFLPFIDNLNNRT